MGTSRDRVAAGRAALRALPRPADIDVLLAFAAFGALLVTITVVLAGQRDGPLDFIAYTSLVLGALLAGETLRARQALQRALAEEAVRAGDAAAQHRFDAERLALAHELHDVVGHTLVAINVRAAAAARRARKGGAAEGTGALDEIASVSAEALAELRTTLKALRSAQDGPAPLQPVQDLAGLGTLIAGVEEAGLAVKLEMAGPSPAVGHAGYRIIQEGLTNVLRHSTARQALVRVEAGHLRVLIEVLDEGRSRPSAEHAVGQAAGHGLAACGSAPPRSAAAARPGRPAEPAGGSGPRSPSREPAGERCDGAYQSPRRRRPLPGPGGFSLHPGR